MANYQIPVQYFVNAQAVTASQGLEPLKLSTILLLTDETPANEITGSYFIARSATAVANQWGTNTETAAQANAIFAQSPNILNNDGYLIVAPYSVETPATVTTIDLTSNLDTLKGVTDGSLTLTIDNSSTVLTKINLSSASTIAEVAELLQAQLKDVTVTASESKIIFSAEAFSIKLAQTTGATTDLYGTSYLDGEAAMEVDGVSETLTAAITRMTSQLYFEGILTTRTVEDEEMEQASAAVQALQNRILANPQSYMTALTGIFKTVASNTFTRNLLYTLGDSETERARNARLFAAAYMSRLLAVNYDGSNTTLTMNLKDLSGIDADTNISETILEQCSTVGADCFPSIEGLAKVVSNEQGGTYADQVANQIWLVTTIQREVFNLLATTRTKIPQTETGTNMIMSVIKDVCVQAVTNGYIAPGSWNSSDTFGNQEDFLRNIEEFGYYIYHQLVSEQSQSDREARKSVPFMVACKEAGAAHSANIQIYLEA